MKNPKILLIDNEPNNVRILKTNFEKAHYNIDQALDDDEAFTKIVSNSYDLVLSELSGSGIDGYHLLEKIQREPSRSHVPFVFITQKSDVWNRVKSFKLGAKDYIVKPMHVQEIIARINMILSRLARRTREESIATKKCVGRIEDVSVSDLIEAFGIERKTGILRIYNIYGFSGQLFFIEGAVVNAFTTSLQAEEAVFKMMSWQKGRFSMFFCDDINVVDEIGLSNLGLLLQGAKRMEQREQLLSELPSLDAVLVTTSNFKQILDKKPLAHDLDYFIRLFDGERTLGRIIDESSYDEITTLKRILKLYRLKFLHVLRDFAKASLSHPLATEEYSFVNETTLQEETRDFVHDRQQIDIGIENNIKNLFPTFSNFDSPDDEEEIEESQKKNLERPDNSEIIEHTQKEEFSNPFDNFLTSTNFDEKSRSTIDDQQQESIADEFDIIDKINQKHPADVLLEVKEEQAFIFHDSDESPIEELDTELNNTTIDTDQKEDWQSPTVDTSESKQSFKKARGTVLVLSTQDTYRKQFLNIFTKGKTQESKELNSGLSGLFWGTAQLQGNHLVNLVSLSIEKEFTPLLDHFSSTMLGCILFLDPEKTDWSYNRYLVRILREKLNGPLVLALITGDHQKTTKDTKKVRSILGLEKNERICIFNQLNSLTSKRIIFSLFELYSKLKKRTSTKSQKRVLHPVR